jgi:hypothetical protein
MICLHRFFLEGGGDRDRKKEKGERREREEG